MSSWFRRRINSTYFNSKEFNVKWNSTLDTLHRTGVNVLLLSTGYAFYLGYQGIKSTREYHKDWSNYNPYYLSDPYFVYNADYMRKQKFTEQQVAYTRPMFAAARAIREKYRIPLQPPYEVVPLRIAVNYNPIKEGPDCNMPEYMTDEQRARWEAKVKAASEGKTEEEVEEAGRLAVEKWKEDFELLKKRVDQLAEVKTVDMDMDAADHGIGGAAGGRLPPSESGNKGGSSATNNNGNANAQGGGWLGWMWGSSSTPSSTPTTTTTTTTAPTTTPIATSASSSPASS